MEAWLYGWMDGWMNGWTDWTRLMDRGLVRMHAQPY